MSEVLHVRGWGVAPLRSTGEGSEQSSAGIGGGAGGKAVDQGEHRRGTTGRTQSRETVSQGLHGVREAARRDKELRFTALLHHVNEGLLRDSFYALQRQAAPGVDRVTWQQYEQGLEARIKDLHGRVHRGAYRAQPSRRIYIPETRWPATSIGNRRRGGQSGPTGGGDGPQRDL